MEDFEGMFGVTKRGALEFFRVHLVDVASRPLDEDQLLYNASILAHYAQVSTQSTGGFPAPKCLVGVFDQFVLDTSMGEDPEVMEVAGAECLFLVGFFEDQMRRRHSIPWYSELGATFFFKASLNKKSRKRALFFEALARDFEDWRRLYARLSRELRDQRYLLRPQ